MAKRKTYTPEPRPAWMGPRRPCANIFGLGRDFPITTGELATLRRSQQQFAFNPEDVTDGNQANQEADHPQAAPEAEDPAG